MIGRRRDFNLLWAGQTVSEVGSAVTVLAFPTLALLSFHAGPAAVGALIAAERLPFPLLALFAGAIVDRLRKRPVMVICNLGRLLLLLGIPVLAEVHSLELWHLFVAAIAMGVCTVFFDIAYLAYIPALSGPSGLLAANSRLEMTMSAASFAGPGLGGLLIQAVSAARAVLLDALSFLVSAITLLSIRHHEPAPEKTQREHLLREIGTGVAHVFRHPVLRSQIVCMGLAGVFAHGLEGPLYVFAYDDLHMSPGALGLVLASQGAGALLGSVVAGPITRWIGVGRTIAIFDGAAIGLGGLIALGTIIPPLLLFFPVFILIGMAGGVGNITQVTLRQSLSPPHLQGRMTSVFRTVFWGGWPLGNLLGGLTAAAIGAGTTIWITALIGMFLNFTIRLTPLWKVRDFGEAEILPA